MCPLSDYGDQFGGFSEGEIERVFVPTPGRWPACMNLPNDVGHFLRVLAINNFDRTDTGRELQISNAKLRNTVSRVRKNLPKWEGTIPTTTLWQVNQCLPVFIWLYRQVEAVHQSLSMLRGIADRCRKLADPLLQHFMRDIYGELDALEVPAEFHGLTPEETLVERGRLLIDAGEPEDALQVLAGFRVPDRGTRPDHPSFWGTYQRGIALKMIGDADRALDVFEALRRRRRDWRRPFVTGVLASVLNQIGETRLVRYDQHRDESDLDLAEARFQEAVQLYAREAFSHRIAFPLSNLGRCARLRSAGLTAGFYSELAGDIFEEFGLKRYVNRMEQECAALDGFQRHNEAQLRSFFTRRYGGLQRWMIRIGRPREAA